MNETYSFTPKTVTKKGILKHVLGNSQTRQVENLVTFRTEPTHDSAPGPPPPEPRPTPSAWATLKGPRTWSLLLFVLPRFPSAWQRSHFPWQ